ncbi:copper chaperone PCu(A)C [Brevundimonas naejangsanensis]|uniref:Copper chaperone PCu(A)C n=1 Tax=Brevundimonas naejangsanensis TaxID=588932 RepID=A0A494RC51_9CAUL|nr:copper chaperone PCu(A)C [Brevundimonas naejangsanensis]AYG93845.1 copper chaperone PCu(A)C [Brevundimonas naejangsanensis]
MKTVSAALPQPLLLAAAALALTACGQPTEKAVDAAAVAPGTVQAADAWCRPTPKGAKVGGCYLTLTAGSDDRLVSVSTALAQSAEVHEMKTENGVMSMGHLHDGLALPAGTPVELKPGGNHIMLMGLRDPLVDGGVASFTLTFEKAGPISVHAAVKQPPVVDSEE